MGGVKALSKVYNTTSPMNAAMNKTMVVKEPVVTEKPFIFVDIPYDDR